MKRYRSILSCILALLISFVVGCGSPEVVEPPTYTSTQIEQIQKYSSEIIGLRDRMTSELSTYIQQRQWVEVDNFIHGPMGSALLTMNYLTRNLLPDDQPQARQLSREIFEYLVDVDKAASKGNQAEAVSSYRKALDNLDTFLDRVSQALPTESPA
ncbi:MAG: photosystem II protein PsbQ [Oscillatoriales cyanobacterium RM2_1_1]|nr:photosystem II protein PsbQ [Oscillatoriales cyanobacterium SM2_3_0]NJO45412.1 photosystem II protein PsbQ [Oscillatoriales cyanobacterium RM2_1_1]